MSQGSTESTEFTEVADRVWVARYPWLDVNVSVVAGGAGLLVLDTQASAELAREVVAALRRVSSLPVLWAVNSHEHWDHTFGNGVLRGEGAELVCHDVYRADGVSRDLGQERKTLDVDHGRLRCSQLVLQKRRNLLLGPTVRVPIGDIEAHDEQHRYEDDDQYADQRRAP